MFPCQIPSVRRKHIYTGAMGAIQFTLLSGLFMVAYVREIGLSYRGLGRLVGLGAFAFAFQLLGAHIAARTGKRRSVWFRWAMISRLCQGVAVVSSFYFCRSSPFLAVSLLVGFLTLAKVFAALSAPPWFSWLADVVPADQHGLFMGRRTFWIALATILVAIPCAALVDWWSETGFGIQAMLLVFAFALALGYLDLFIHRTIPEPAMKPEPERRFFRETIAVFRDRKFRSVLVFSSAWGLAMSVGSTMFMLYAVEELGFRHNLTAGVLVFTAVPLLTTLLTSRYLGGLIDRLGTRPVLFWSHLLWSVMPAVYFFATRETAAYWLLGAFLVGRPAVYSAMLARQKLVCRLPRREDRSMYVAVSSCVASAAVGVGAIIAGEVLQLLSGWSFALGGATFSGFHVLFGASILLRLGATTLVRSLPAPAVEREHIRASEAAETARKVA